MDHSRAQRVGTEFVRQYYTLLHEDPLQLHRFYLDQSSFVHASGQSNDEPVVGQKRIYEKMRALSFVDCRTTIRQTDSQPTLDKAIVVQVCGEISNNGAPMRPFVQTFVLSPESAKKYYVRNDIFRYQDEIWETSATTSAPAQTADPISLDVSTADSTPYGAAQVINGSAGANDPPPERTEGEGAETNARAPPDEQDNVEDQGEPPLQGKEEEEEPPTKSSWANVAASSKVSQKRGGGGTVTSSVNPPPPPGIAALPQRERPPTRRQPNPQGGGGIVESPKVVNQQMPAPTPISSSQTAPPPMPPRQSRHPDTHQIFIGNLPNTVTEQQVRDAFSEWGNVIEIRLNPKHFGFVIFDGPIPVQKLLKHVESGKNQILVNKSRVNLEEKKSLPKLGGGGRKDGGMPYQNRSGGGGGGERGTSRFGGAKMSSEGPRR